MRNPNRHLAGIGRILVLLFLAVVTAGPSWAQFGGLKKALKNKAAEKGIEAAAPDAAAPKETGAAPAKEDNSTLVLTSDVVDRFLAGVRASKAEYEAAAKDDTPYGRYTRAKAAYDTAKGKCDEAQAKWPSRLAADEKLMNRNGALLEKMMAAAQKKDQKTQQMYADSMLAIVDASCLVKQPEQPSEYWDAQRGLEFRSGQAASKAAQMSATQYSQVSERIYAILQGSDVPGGASPSETAAVNAKAPELKSLLGIRTAQEGRIAKQAPTPAPAPVAPADTQPVAKVPAAATAMNACMVQNVQAHEKEIEALGNRGDAAKKAGDTATMMAIADSIMRIQMAGCGGNR